VVNQQPEKKESGGHDRGFEGDEAVITADFPEPVQQDPEQPFLFFDRLVGGREGEGVLVHVQAGFHPITAVPQVNVHVGVAQGDDQHAEGQYDQAADEQVHRPGGRAGGVAGSSGGRCGHGAIIIWRKDPTKR